MTFVPNNHTDPEQRQFIDNLKLQKAKISLPSFVVILASKTGPNIVAVVGNSGGGKTSFLKSVLLHPELKKVYKFMFFLQCQHVDFNMKTNLLQLLATTLPYQWIQDKTVCVDVLQELEKSEQVLILIDDFCHVLATLPPQDSAATSIHDEASANSFVQGILSRRLLPKAKVVITACTHSLCNLDKHLISFPMFKILGLNLESRNKLCMGVCGESTESVLKYLNFHPDLQSFCNTPENCAAVMHVISAFMKQQGDDSTAEAHLSPTRVAVAAYALILQRKRSRPETKVIYELAALAWRKFKDETLSFTKDEFPNESHFDSISELAYIELENNMKFVQKFYKLWRDILAAIYCNFFMEFEDFRLSFESGCKKFPNKFRRFALMHLSELCHRPTTRYLKKLLPFCLIHPEKLKLVQNCIEEKG